MSLYVRDEIIMDERNALLTKYVGFASFTVLIWDHIITFSDEVEYIWKGKKGIAVYLFLLNRILIPLSFIVDLVAYCKGFQNRAHFVRYGGSMTMIGISVVALLMFIRIRALYAGILSVQAFVFTIFLTFIGVNSWLLTRGVPVEHPPNSPVDSCTMIIDQKVPRALASGTAWLPLLYGTIVVFLTLRRTARSAYSKDASQMFRILLQQGLLYYSVICTVTLVLTIQILHAQQSVRDIASQLHLCLTVAMMSRLTLSLKGFAHRSNGGVIIYNDGEAAHLHLHHRHHQQHQHHHHQPESQTLGLISSSSGMTFAPGPGPGFPPPRRNVVPSSPASAHGVPSEGGGVSYYPMQTFSFEAVPAPAPVETRSRACK